MIDHTTQITGLTILLVVGIIVGYTLARLTDDSYQELKAIKKKHLDILNWLRSESAHLKIRKPGKTPNRYRIDFLELLIKKLKK